MNSYYLAVTKMPGSQEGRLVALLDREMMVLTLPILTREAALGFLVIRTFRPQVHDGWTHKLQ